MLLTRNLLVVIFLALSLFSASCNAAAGLLQTGGSNHRHRHRRGHDRKHHKGGHNTKPVKGRKQPHQKVFSVDDFGAKGDGTTDDSEVYIYINVFLYVCIFFNNEINMPLYIRQYILSKFVLSVTNYIRELNPQT